MSTYNINRPKLVCNHLIIDLRWAIYMNGENNRDTIYSKFPTDEAFCMMTPVLPPCPSICSRLSDISTYCFTDYRLYENMRYQYRQGQNDTDIGYQVSSDTSSIVQYQYSSDTFFVLACDTSLVLSSTGMFNVKIEIQPKIDLRLKRDFGYPNFQFF